MSQHLVLLCMRSIYVATYDCNWKREVLRTLGTHLDLPLSMSLHGVFCFIDLPMKFYFVRIVRLCSYFCKQEKKVNMKCHRTFYPGVLTFYLTGAKEYVVSGARAAHFNRDFLSP